MILASLWCISDSAIRTGRTRLGKYLAELISALVQDLQGLSQPDQTPGPIASSFALGTLLSFIPAPVLDTMLVGIILRRAKRINRPALLAARLVWNDLLVIPLYAVGYRLGTSIIALGPDTGSRTIPVAIAFLLGLLLLALIASSFSALTVFALYALFLSMRRNFSDRIIMVRLLEVVAPLAQGCRPPRRFSVEARPTRTDHQRAFANPNLR